MMHGSVVLFFCRCFIKAFSPGTKGCGLAFCFLLATSLAPCLCVLSVFWTSSSMMIGACCSASSSLMWHDLSLKGKNTGSSPVVLCGVT